MKEIWLQIAEAFDKADENGFASFSGESRKGICSVVILLCDQKVISEDMMHDMLELMYKHRPPNINGHRWFWWPTNADGAKERAAFCRRMAELC